MDIWNNLLLTDSYKVTHHLQYPPGTTRVYSYFESRGGEYPDVVFFGLQYIIKKWLQGPVVTEEKIKEAKEMFKMHFGNDKLFNEEGWRYILTKHKGHLPLRIRAVREGSIIPTKNVLFTVENTDEKCYWLTNYVETLLVQVWYPMTVATISRNMKVKIAKQLKETSDSMDGLLFKLHDFGFRGATSVEAAGLGGCAHLVNFTGTDTLAALLVAKNFYGCECAGYSIPAAEHSTMTSWGPKGEEEAYKNMIQTFQEGPVAVVSDSYDIYNACSKLWGTALKEEIMKRKTPLVIRPDSGEPTEVVPKVLNILGERFGSTTNSKGYKVLPPCVRVIQGDGISLDSIQGVLDCVVNAGWSTDNLTLGCGGGLLQKLNRDTQKCAMKCCYVETKGESRNVFKQPVTDPGKNSKKGILTLVKKPDGAYETVQEGKGDLKQDELITVFENGKLLVEQNLKEIRQLAKTEFEK